MNLGADIAAALPALRAAAITRMTETVTAGEFHDVTDPETGNSNREPVTTLYTGAAQVKYPPTAVLPNTVAQPIGSQDVIVKLPPVNEWGEPTPVLPAGTTIHVTASTSDAALVGREYNVDGVPSLGQTTTHRYRVTELS